jgi:hypothetical protein
METYSDSYHKIDFMRNEKNWTKTDVYRERFQLTFQKRQDASKRSRRVLDQVSTKTRCIAKVEFIEPLGMIYGVFIMMMS